MSSSSSSSSTYRYIDNDGNVNGYDYAVIGIVLFAVMIAGFISSLIANKSPWLKYIPFLNENTQSDNNKYGEDHVEKKGETDAAANFFLADRSMKFYWIGASLFASNIGSEHFTGQAGDGARRGLPVAMFEWTAAILLLPLGWVFAPIYHRAGVYTTPEFLEKRFSPIVRHYLSCISIFMYIVTKMSASIFGGAAILSSTLGWNLYISAGACIILTGMYTVSGGLRAVMYTDFVQASIFITGGFVVLHYALQEVGGFSGLQEKLAEQGKEDHWHLWKPIDDEDYPWFGLLFGKPIDSLWYWCLDQDLVQRVLSAKSDEHSKAGCVMASFLKLIPPFIMIMPGIITSVLFNLEEAPEGYDSAYPVMLTNLMPHGVIGLMIASIMVAMMSSLDSVFNAGSSIVLNDIYLLWYPDASEKSKKWVGRLATLAFAILSFCWLPMLNKGKGLYRTISEIQANISAPMGIVLLVGVAWKRVNATGAISGLFFGTFLGLIRFVGIQFFEDQVLSTDFPSSIQWFFSWNFLNFEVFLWVSTLIILVVVTLMTPAPDAKTAIYCIQYNEIFKLDPEKLAYSKWVSYFVLAAAVASLACTFSLWGIYA